MMFFAYSVIAIALSLCLYTYLGYPLIPLQDVAAHKHRHSGL